MLASQQVLDLILRFAIAIVAALTIVPPIHDALPGIREPERQSGKHIRDHVEKQDLQRQQRHRKTRADPEPFGKELQGRPPGRLRGSTAASTMGG